MQTEQNKVVVPIVNNKFLLKNGRQVVDYIDEAGFGLGFAVGNAVRLCFKAGQTADPAERKKLMDGCSWYIDHAAKVTKINKNELVEIVTRITARIEKDQLGDIQ